LKKLLFVANVFLVGMYGLREKRSDDWYMYKFRTNLCTKRRCRKSWRCFDAHSLLEKRRVPMQGQQGLFNYIPKPCPEWERNNKCIIGDSCPRAHGWSEMIFHPLLYKTKMCASYQRYGVCRQKGVYCGNAHKETEIRRRVEIFGWNWKKHCDLSLREGCTRSTIKLVNTDDKSVGHKEVGSHFSEIILKYLEGFPSELSDIMRQPTLKEMLGQFDKKSNINKICSRVVNHTSRSGSLLSASLSDMSLYDEVSNYELPIE